MTDLSGVRFGRLMARRRAPALGRNGAWHCICDCGAETIVRTDNLKRGTTRSCGCLARDVWRELARKLRPKNPPQIKHGQFGTRLYRIWVDIKGSCRKPKHWGYSRRGAKGISYTADWEDFVPFYHWALENGYTEASTLKRRNRKGNFEPQNCYWHIR
jgi:hypothetical protein